MRKIPSYSKYVEAYAAKANQLAKRGYQMYDQMMDASEYIANYQALRNDQLRDIQLGKRKTAGNILRDLVNDQAYQFSKKQAMRQLEVAKQFGYKTNVQKLMAGDAGLGDILEAQKDLLRKQGLSNREVNLIMSQEYFGSP